MPPTFGDSDVIALRRRQASAYAAKTWQLFLSPLLPRGARLRLLPQPWNMLLCPTLCPTRTPCETEWASKSLTELVAHLSQRYRRPLRERLESIRSTLAQGGLFNDEARRADYDHLASSFERLRAVLTSTTGSKRRCCVPRWRGSSTASARQTRGPTRLLSMLVMTVADEHRLIQRRIDEFERALDAVLGRPMSPHEALLIADLEMLDLLLNEQLNLEDRCLWPRVLVLLRPGL